MHCLWNVQQFGNCANRCLYWYSSHALFICAQLHSLQFFSKTDYCWSPFVYAYAYASSLWSQLPQSLQVLWLNQAVRFSRLYTLDTFLLLQSWDLLIRIETPLTNFTHLRGFINTSTQSSTNHSKLTAVLRDYHMSIGEFPSKQLRFSSSSHHKTGQ